MLSARLNMGLLAKHLLQGGAVRIKKVDGVQIHAVSGQYKAEQDRASAHKGEGLTEHKKEDHHRHLEDAIGEVRCTPSLPLSLAHLGLPRARS